MPNIIGVDGMTDDQIHAEIKRGGRFVSFDYTISIIIMTFRRSSDIYFLRAGESATSPQIGFTVLTFFLGWWGIPWGPIYTIGSLYRNLTGGRDVTQELLQAASAARLEQAAHLARETNRADAAAGQATPATDWSRPNPAV